MFAAQKRTFASKVPHLNLSNPFPPNGFGGDEAQTPEIWVNKRTCNTALKRGIVKLPTYVQGMTTDPLNPLTKTLDHGSSAVASRWRAYLAQFTQTQLLKLSDAHFGGRFFHSSQMGGFAKRTLRDPAPKAFLAFGYLNVAHARSVGWPQIEEVKDIGLPQKLPETMAPLWRGREPFTDANGVALGPVGFFEAFTGLRTLTEAPERTLKAEHEAVASAALGSWLRKRLAARGVDWLPEIPRLNASCSSAGPLLMGSTIPADVLLHHLPQLASVADVTDDELWEVVLAALPS